MADRALSQNDIAFGRAVLLATDKLNMAVEGAFWVHATPDQDWRYFLVTSLCDRIGPREIYLRLNEALSKILSKDEIDRFVYYICGPREKLARTLNREIATSRHASLPQEISFSLGDRRAKAIVYRMSGRMDEMNVRRVQRRFGTRYRELLSA